MADFKNTTLVFLVKQDSGKITEVCLAMKKRGFGIGRWNGAGGKVEPGETVEVAAKRELFEEVTVKANDLKQVAELTFVFSQKPEWNQLCRVYFCEEWSGEPQESEEMKPQWFMVENIPYNKMWPDDIFWLPQVVAGKLVRAQFAFGPNDSVDEQQVDVINHF